MLTIQELRQLQEKELTEELTKSERELVKARMDQASGTLKETHRLPQLKRYIARMKTVKTESMREKPAKPAIAAKASSETETAAAPKKNPPAKKTSKKQ